VVRRDNQARARSLRTQQRANTHPTTRPAPSNHTHQKRTPATHGVLEPAHRSDEPAVDVPPMSTTPSTSGQGMGLNTTPTTNHPPHRKATSRQAACECSLERR